MNITDVIEDIKKPCGLNTIALPFKESVENAIRDIITTSVRTFSQFKPQEKECQCERRFLRYQNEYERANGIYLIPEQLTSTPVMYCDAYPISSQKVDTANQVGSNAFSVVSPFVGFGSYYPQDIMNATITGAAVNKFIGVSSQVPTSRWRGHNKIQLLNWPKESFILFVAKCDHDLSLETIPDSCRESFIELATLDVQRTIYNDIKNQIVGSAFRNIQINIDNFAGAEEARKALVKEWGESFHLDEVEECVVFF
ncbi:MAG: hypothetical protein IKU29_00345 [Parabacteroides sp.]|nr:hypothetical protein [Parabacteroides sp.]